MPAETMDDVASVVKNGLVKDLIREGHLTGPAVTETTLMRSAGTQTSDTGADSDDESCDPEVEPSTKRYVKKLLLRHGLLSDSDLCSSASDTEPIVMENESSTPVEIPAKSSDAEEICTSDNWKSFLSFQRKSSNDITLHPCDPEEFEESESLDAKALNLTKYPGGHVELAISSTYLQNQFRKLVDIQNYHSVVLSSKLRLGHPFAPLYHHVDDIRAIVAKDADVTQTERNNMDALYHFVYNGWPARLYKDVRSKISQGFIIYDEMWALFRPEDIVICEDIAGHHDLYKVASVKLEQEPSRSSNKIEYSWYVSLVKNTWNRQQFQKATRPGRITRFAGTKKITDLDFYPLSHHETRDLVRVAAIERGKSWKKYCEGGPTVMSYHGQALPLFARHSIGSSPPDVTIQRGYDTLGLISTVIVDPDATSKAILQASIDQKQIINHPSWNHVTVNGDASIAEFCDEEFLICPANITVFNLDDHEWFVVGVASLKEKDWKPAAFGRLVLDPEKKETLTRLAKTNSRLVQASKSKDVIEGKGKGVVLLLHGPPGVGKTLTAEVLSEFTKRPLLKVNLGRIASHENWEQSLEQIFSNAEDWKAILLIDEAEIVLEKRTFERMRQNSWISVFLRKLEYYKGILILTTNLVDCIDDAFESRISYPIRFRELSRNDRHQIWADFINAMNMLPAYKALLMSEVGRWSEAEINGRQIRNIILMAENLASSNEKHPRLMPQHIDELLNVTIEFCDYNQNNSSRTKKIQLTGLSY